jgi:hypothetical protein
VTLPSLLHDAKVALVSAGVTLALVLLGGAAVGWVCRRAVVEFLGKGD